jgi:RNA polymerase sigma-70 factor
MASPSPKSDHEKAEPADCPPDRACDEAKTAAGSLLDRVLREGKRAWPDVELGSAQVAAFLEPRISRLASSSPSAEADLFLTCACLTGIPEALRHLEALCRSELHIALRRMPMAMEEDDVLASLMAKLLVAEPGAEPKLSGYVGYSELHRWIRIVAVNHMLDMTKPCKQEPLTEALLEEIESGAAPEWRAMDTLGRQAFKEALGKALDDLSWRDRNLLRHRLEGMTLTAIAAFYKLSLPTVSRWSSRVQVIVEHAVLSEMRERLRLARPDLDSLVRSLLGQVDTSIRAEMSRAVQDEPK